MNKLSAKITCYLSKILKAMLSEKNFELLDVVARMGSFSAAADYLHKVPSSVSYTVRQIEQDLDVVLFRRLPRRVELTPAGELFLEQVRTMLRQLAEAKSQAKRAAHGWQNTLKLTLDNVVKLDQLQHLINDFYAEFEFAELQINMEVFNGAWEAISQNRADIVLGATSAVPVGGDYKLKPMGKLKWVFVCAYDHPLAESEALSVEDIMKYPSISLDDTSRELPKRYHPVIGHQRRLLVPNWHTAVRCVKQGIGVGFLPDHIAAQQILTGEMVIKELDMESPASECCMVWREQNNNKLIDWMVEYLGDSEQLYRQWIQK